MRTGRTNGTNTYEYIYNGSQLKRMTRNGVVVDFTYINGIPATISFNGNTFYYVVNGQGDITGITDSEGNLQISYYYDAWGNSSYTVASGAEYASTLLTINPLLYRGYVLDREVGMYYLQSRYYIPEIGRFLNADAYASTGQGFGGDNMFTYCLNNPINMIDISGQYPVYMVKKVETKRDGDYYVTAITYTQYDPYMWMGYFYQIDVTAEFRYTISNNGTIQMSNKDNELMFLYDKKIIDALSTEMQIQAERVRQDSLEGRTTSGMSFEIIIHSFCDFIGIFKKNAEPIDMGATNDDSIGFDYNADWFENPFDHLVDIIKTIF